MLPLALLSLVLAQPPAEPALMPSLPDADPEKTQVVASVLLCYGKEVKRAAVAGIAEEKHAARYAGVVSLTRLHGLQSEARRGDRTIAENKKVLREVHRTALSCTRADVAYLAACMRGTDTGWAEDWCQTASWRAFWEQVEGH